MTETDLFLNEASKPSKQEVINTIESMSGSFKILQADHKTLETETDALLIRTYGKDILLSKAGYFKAADHVIDCSDGIMIVNSKKREPNKKPSGNLMMFKQVRRVWSENWDYRFSTAICTSGNGVLNVSEPVVISLFEIDTDKLGFLQQGEGMMTMKGHLTKGELSKRQWMEVMTTRCNNWIEGHIQTCLKAIELNKEILK